MAKSSINARNSCSCMRPAPFASVSASVSASASASLCLNCLKTRTCPHLNTGHELLWMGKEVPQRSLHFMRDILRLLRVRRFL